MCSPHNYQTSRYKVVTKQSRNESFLRSRIVGKHAKKKVLETGGGRIAKRDLPKGFAKRVAKSGRNQ